MAFLSGIGRAFTSIGSDMQRNRLEREDREQRFTVLREERAYADRIRDQQAGIRAAETEANRDYARIQEEARRTWQTTRDIRLAGEADTRTALQNTEIDARADRAARRATDVRTEGRLYDEGQFDEGVDAMNRIAETLPTGSRPAGQQKPIPYPDEPWSAASPGDRALMQRERLTFETPATSRAPVQPTEALMARTEEDIYREQGSYDDAGMLVGDPVPTRDVYNRASQIANQNLYRVPPPQATSPQFDPYAPPRARPRPGPLDQPGQSPAPRRDAGSQQRQQPGQPMVSPEEFEMAKRSGRYTQEQLDAMLGGRWDPYGQSGR